MDALKFIGTYLGTNYYLGDVSKDTFIHFTLLERANKIQESGVIFANPPGIKKFGIDGVQAVSTTYGKHQPEVQWTHLKTSNFVAVVFQTSAMPKVGHIEEVIWPNDVPVSNLKIVQQQVAASMFHGADEDICVIYDPNHPWIAEIKEKIQPQSSSQDAVEAWVRGNCKFSV